MDTHTCARGAQIALGWGSSPVESFLTLNHEQQQRVKRTGRQEQRELWQEEEDSEQELSSLELSRLSPVQFTRLGIRKRRWARQRGMDRPEAPQERA